jgi:hypothetical protein
MSTDNKLDEKGFVYKTIDGKLFYIRMNGDQPWVHYHADGQWVTLRPVNQTEIALAYKAKISDEETEELHKIAFR